MNGSSRNGYPAHDATELRIALWRRERPDIDCSGKEVTGRILRLAEIFTMAMNANMAQFDIRFSHYAIVATLRAAGCPYRMSPTDIQNTMMITSGGVSNLLRKVELMGLVRRLDDPSDGRGVIVELTDKGLALSEATMRAQADAEHRLIGTLSPEEREALAALLKKLTLALG